LSIRFPAPIFAVCAVILALLGMTAPANAQSNKISLIRDAEIENIIRAYSTPLFQAAGLNPDDVRIHLVNDRSLNAFVAGGQRLFINTGLILQSAHSGQLIGVIAHETGHISGGHLAKMEEEMRRASAQQILAMILGGAAAIGTGRGDAGAAVIMGGASTAMRGFLAFTRTQESAADAAALKVLDLTRQSAQGFLEFMQVLEKQDPRTPDRQDPYLRTHPLSRERVEVLRQHVAASPYSSVPLSAAFENMHQRMKAKLYAFLNPLGHTLRQYPERDKSLVARYARAIAYYRAPQLDKALELVDGLIRERPDDPYFNELKGQMLFENGRVAESIGLYQTAVRLLPNSGLLKGDLARAQIEAQDPALLEAAIANLNAALREDRAQPFYWRQLAIAYGRRGEMAESSLALAEEAMLLNRAKEARYHAGRAEQLLPRGSPGWLQAQDILEHAREKK
jgi:predicted Zn-dependent protease